MSGKEWAVTLMSSKSGFTPFVYFLFLIEYTGLSS